MKLLPLKRPARPAPTSQTGATSADSKATSNSGATDSNHGIGRGMEFAVMVLLFFGVGYALDRWLGTKPIFMIVLVVLAIVGQFASLYYGYDERMKAHEQRRQEASRKGRPARETKLR
jgi:F0F1-type ATP synthase assembly protein I